MSAECRENGPVWEVGEGGEGLRRSRLLVPVSGYQLTQWVSALSMHQILQAESPLLRFGGLECLPPMTFSIGSLSPSYSPPSPRLTFLAHLGSPDPVLPSPSLLCVCM